MPDLLAVLHHAVRARLLDERLAQLGRAGRIGVHPDARGFEPAIVAAVLAMRPQDAIFPSAREHAACLVRGTSIATYVAHALGNADDPMHGHAPPGHLACRGLRIGSPSGLFSNHLSHAAGYAWAARLRREPIAVLAMLSETAADTGDFHSALNFAGVTKAPCIFFCRTDRTARRPAVPTPLERVADKGIGYGVEAISCSADDPASVAAAIARAIARAEQGPTLIEAVRQDERDPLEALREALVAAGAWDASRHMALRRETMSEIERAIEQAQQVPPPAFASMFADVHGEPPRILPTEPSNEHPR